MIEKAEPTGVIVHESSYVDKGAELGEGTKVWHFSHILSNTKIGKRCSLGQNVVVGPNVTVGDDCKIQNNVSIYDGVTLEAGVFCGPSCVFTNVRNPRAFVSRKEKFEPTLVRRGATIGANATIRLGVTLGEYCFVAAGAVVTKDVRPHALVAGVPATQIGWVSHAGEVLHADMTCVWSGDKYQVQDGRLVRVERGNRTIRWDDAGSPVQSA
jgi:UDP-2-acetamido-3-amino-2,3-dideoxy-glucuronate N-acetyltransferase